MTPGDKVNKVMVNNTTYQVNQITGTAIDTVPAHNHTDQYFAAPAISSIHQHTMQYPQPVLPHQDWGSFIKPQNHIGPVEGIDELCQILGVSPATETVNGLFLIGRDEKLFSLVEIIAAQLGIMEKLHVLLVHRNLTPESGE